MKIYYPVILCLAVLSSISNPGLAQDASTAKPADSDVETIVAIRHGGKPAGGLGNLNCQGLNRALALPDVLLSKFGKPTFVFAPNPGEKADFDFKKGQWGQI